MKLGIIGLPQSGKTTIFNALTRANTPTTASAGRIEVHNAVVDVPDPRVTKLSGMFNPKKTIYAKVTLRGHCRTGSWLCQERHFRATVESTESNGRLDPGCARLHGR
jgi:ABC-type polysaccharide/polyol phosphate transport system ATPase subunit